MTYDIFSAGILGVVEGITEFLPISSTAHLMLASDVLGIPQTEFQKSFEISIQLGAIFSVVMLYWRSLLRIEVMKRILVAFIPTGVLGALLYTIVKRFLLGNTSVVLWSLLVGGILLIVFEMPYRKTSAQTDDIEGDIAHISFWKCFVVGLFQSIAMIPGVSRSAATVVGGLSIGIPRKTIVEFSFLLAVPTLFAATVLDITKNYKTFAGEQFEILFVGMAVSCVVAIASIRWLLSYIRRHDFRIFGVYRILLALLFFFFRG